MKKWKPRICKDSGLQITRPFIQFTITIVINDKTNFTHEGRANYRRDDRTFCSVCVTIDVVTDNMLGQRKFSKEVADTFLRKYISLIIT